MKSVTPDEAVAAIPDGATLVVPGGCASPSRFYDAFSRGVERFTELTVCSGLSLGDYRFLDNYELLVEARMLHMPDLDERRSGALATVSRYLGDHLKIGIGYNFTDFSDDLTDLSFDHQGVFLNITGAL